MVSRQMCVDVYVDILPAAKKLFVCKRRLISGLVKHLARFSLPLLLGKHPLGGSMRLPLHPLADRKHLPLHVGERLLHHLDLLHRDAVVRQLVRVDLPRDEHDQSIGVDAAVREETEHQPRNSSSASPLESAAPSVRPW